METRDLIAAIDVAGAARRIVGAVERIAAATLHGVTADDHMLG